MAKKNQFLEILVEADQQRYIELRDSLSSEKNKYQRFHRTDAFDSLLEQIKNFCIRGDDDDWKRCMVCGVCWPPNCIGVNVKQLMLTTGKSKSNINGVFTKMGYMVDSMNLDLKRELIDTIPFLKGNYLEQRFWTIRVNNSKTPIPKHEDSFMSSPEMSSMTPEPKHTMMEAVIGQPGFNTPAPNPSVIGDEMKTIFDIFSFEIKESECGEHGMIDCDFFSDPACCCPSEWFTPTEPINNMLSFA